MGGTQFERVFQEIDMTQIKYIVEFKDNKFLGKYNRGVCKMVNGISDAEMFTNESHVKDFLKYMDLPKLRRFRQVVVNYMLVD